jgi:hypothetical protein
MRRELAEPLPPDSLTDDAILPQRAFFAAIGSSLTRKPSPTTIQPLPARNFGGV